MRGDHGETRLAFPVGMSPIPGQQSAEPFPVLDGQRLIEAHLRGDPGDIGLRHARNQRELRERTAGREMQDGKADQRNEAEQDEALHAASEQIACHSTTFRVSAGSWTCAVAPRSGPHPYQLAQYQVLAFQQFSCTLTFGANPSSLAFTPCTTVY